MAARPGRKRQAAPTPGERVRAERLRAGLTQDDLATRAGKHVNTIANLEDGKAPARLTARGWRTVEDVARALGTTPDHLGYKQRQSVAPQSMTSEQREIVEDILALPSDDLAAVREMLQGIQSKKRSRRR